MDERRIILQEIIDRAQEGAGRQAGDSSAPACNLAILPWAGPQVRRPRRQRKHSWGPPTRQQQPEGPVTGTPAHRHSAPQSHQLWSDHHRAAALVPARASKEAASAVWCTYPATGPRPHQSGGQASTTEPQQRFQDRGPAEAAIIRRAGTGNSRSSAQAA